MILNVSKFNQKSDVMIENFRPGIMKKLGLDYESVHELNPKLVYGTVTGYGSTGPWIAKPGQDLLVQSLSGLAWLNGNANHLLCLLVTLLICVLGSI